MEVYIAMLLLLLLCSKRKRTCRLDLGGHCATENAVAVADNWHYLNSHLSPGRRKRRAPPHLSRDRDYVQPMWTIISVSALETHAGMGVATGVGGYIGIYTPQNQLLLVAY